MLAKTKKKIKSLSHFIWLILLIIITSFVTYFYEANKKTQYKNLKISFAFAQKVLIFHAFFNI